MERGTEPNFGGGVFFCVKMSTISEQIKTRRQAAEDYLRIKRLGWDQAEELFHNQLNDSISASTKSNVFDPSLSTLAIERSYRVMAQLQSGKVKGISKNDIGDAMLKNLILEKYVLPNANSQFDFLTKMRMVDMYSNIYGNFFTLVDWNIKKEGYVGPDVWLLNIRDVFPQVGAVSLEDSDYVIVRTWKPLSFFEGLKNNKDYKNISQILEKLKGKSGSKGNKPSQARSMREADQYPQEDAPKDSGYFEVLTQYERDRWVDYVTDADLEFRDIKNPHEDNDLPVKCKYSIPLLDDFMGMSDFERGASMQKTKNSIWNLYLDGVKMSIFPPVLINKDNIASMSSLKMDAAAKWLVRHQINNSAQTINLTPQGINTFDTVYRTVTASILNLFGTTDTNVSGETDPGFGKTPRALSIQAQRENTRDNADRFYMEQYLSSVMKKFCNLLAKKQTTAIKLRLFEEEINDLARSYPEIEQDYNKQNGTLSVKKGSGSELYDYEIVTGSTYAVDQKQQQQNLGNLLTLFQQAQTPNGNLLIEQLKQDGFSFNFGELMKRIISNSGIQDWDKILKELTPQEQGDNTLQQHSDMFQQALLAAQNINQTPAMPGQQSGQMGGMEQGNGMATQGMPQQMPMGQ